MNRLPYRGPFSIEEAAIPRQANGTYLAPANTSAISGQSISSVAFNTLETDIGTEITNSLDRGGRSAMTGPLPMGGQKITGMADPTAATDGATKNYVDTATATFFGTGDIKLTLKTVADSGWLLFDDGTFGNAGSGSSNNNSVANLALFTLFFNNLSDAAAPILTSGGGATTRAAQTNAATAWASLCRMSLPKTLGRALAVAGSGSGLTARALGSTTGVESESTTLAQLPTGITSANAGAINLSVTTSSSVGVGNSPILFSSGGNGANTPAGVSTVNSTGTIPIGSATVTSNNTSGAAHSLMQPTVFLNAMVKI
jgi:hypothetical protein